MLLLLSFHKVSESNGNGVYSLALERFRKFLQVILRSGVPVVDPRDLSPNWSRERHGALLTFDDGTIDHFTVVASELARNRLRGLFYIPTAKVDKENYLSWQQVRLLAEAGHTIASHGHSHRRMDVMPEYEIVYELEQSREILAHILGSQPIHFAPPGGVYTSAVHSIAQTVGYRFFRTSRWGYNRTLDVGCIEIVPMTSLVNERILKRILCCQGEFALRLAYGAKQSVKRLIPSPIYIGLREKLMTKIGH